MPLLRKLDPFLCALITAVLLASFLPCPERFQPILNALTALLIMMMFFLHGARLQRSALWESLRDWKLQMAILATTYILFPLIGLAWWKVFVLLFPEGIIGTNLWKGVLFLCCLPSTVQSSIALTSIAKGNVSTSICAASLSNILGVFITPAIVPLVIGITPSGEAEGDILGPILSVGKELLLPFVAGQLCQAKLGARLRAHRKLLSFSDRGSIILMVYAAFSTAVLEGLWHKVSLFRLVALSGVDLLILITLLTLSWAAGRYLLRLDLGNEISMQFCGSKKALSSGIPMAAVLFGANTGIMVLPLMIYHQLQLFVGTMLARHYAARQNEKDPETHAGISGPQKAAKTET